MPRRTRRLKDDDYLFELDGLCAVFSRVKAALVSSEQTGSSTNNGYLEVDLVMDAYVSSCKIPVILRDLTVREKLAQRPSVITHRWDAFRYWIAYAGTVLELQNVNGIFQRHGSSSPQICVFRLLNALHELGIESITDLIREDKGIFSLVAHTWLSQSRQVLDFKSLEPTPSRRKLLKWCKMLPPDPSQVILIFLSGGGASEGNLRQFFRWSGDDFEFLALASIQRLRNSLHAHSPTVLRDIHTYIQLITFLHSMNHDDLQASLLKHKFVSLIARALRLHIDFLIGNHRIAAEETVSFVMVVSMTIQLVSHLLRNPRHTGSILIRQMAHSDLFQTLTYIYTITQGHNIPQLNLFHEIADKFLRMDLPRHLHNYTTLGRVIDSFNRFTFAAAHFVKAIPSVSLVWAYTIERAILRAMFDRAKLNERCRCKTCNELFRSGVLRLCSSCKAVRYCSTTCQAADWKRGHSFSCHRLRKMEDSTTAGMPQPSSGRETEFIGFFSLMDIHLCRPGIHARALRRFPNIPAHDLILQIDYTAQPLAVVTGNHTVLAPVFWLGRIEDIPDNNPLHASYHSTRQGILRTNRSGEHVPMFVLSRVLLEREAKIMVLLTDLGLAENNLKLIRPHGPGYSERFVGKSRAACGIRRTDKYMLGDKRTPLATVPWDEVDEVWARAVEKTKEGSREVTIWDAIEKAVMDVEEASGIYHGTTRSGVLEY